MLVRPPNPVEFVAKYLLEHNPENNEAQKQDG